LPINLNLPSDGAKAEHDAREQGSNEESTREIWSKNIQRRQLVERYRMMRTWKAERHQSSIVKKSSSADQDRVAKIPIGHRHGGERACALIHNEFLEVSSRHKHVNEASVFLY
jgi:hypothetical protein